MPDAIDAAHARAHGLAVGGVDGLEPAESAYLLRRLPRQLTPGGHVGDRAARVRGPDHDRARFDERPVAFDRLLELRACSLVVSRQHTELLVGLLELLGHDLALLELVLELHRLLLELLSGDREVDRRVHGLGAGAPHAVEGRAEEARDEEKDEGGEDSVVVGGAKAPIGNVVV